MLRSSEWVLTGYYVYCMACSVILPVRAGVMPVTLAINALVIGGLLLLAYAENLRHKRLLGIMRDWYPLPLMLLAYREMGWFAPESHTYRLEQGWVVYDRLLLSGWGLRALIESAGPLLPSMLEICYSLVYAIAPFCMGWLYHRRHVSRMNAFLTTFLLGIFLSYVCFPFFPSEPPRTVFPGQDLPGIVTVFRRFNLGLVGNYGIHMSVFPSAHCSGAFAAAFAMRRILPEEPWIGRGLFALACGIALATIYGRYHYAADAAAGIAVAVVAYYVANRIQ
ncbi:MAG: phosphatase PAP2 family protein [Bryobacterales bacterium]|nr:phosphatase PAP2 family protein [Bryobacterales bacterium]